MNPRIAYKVLTAPQMAELEEKGVFSGALIDLQDGYIHMSTAAQLTATVDKHFAGQDDLYVAAIDLEALDAPVKWEVSRGNALFPHLYGLLPLQAVIAYGPLKRDESGAVELPASA